MDKATIDEDFIKERRQNHIQLNQILCFQRMALAQEKLIFEMQVLTQVIGSGSDEETTNILMKTDKKRQKFYKEIDSTFKKWMDELIKEFETDLVKDIKDSTDV